MTKERSLLAILAIILIVCIATWILSSRVPAAVGSTVVGNDYHASTTASGANFGASTGSSLIRAGYGALGSVVITGANTAIFNLYDATTTNVALRTGQKASSTILLASFPASATAGDYVFDVEFSQGLLLDVISGIMPTSTITYR